MKASLQGFKDHRSDAFLGKIKSVISFSTFHWAWSQHFIGHGVNIPLGMESAFHWAWSQHSIGHGVNHSPFSKNIS
jgi:hypothetical protein